MEFDAVTTAQLETLARQKKTLEPYFVGVFAADTLPKTPRYLKPQAYIVNTDPHHRPGRQWIALWTKEGVCQVMDSFGLPLATHGTPHLQTWLRRHWSVVECNTQSLQAINSATCGHYALRFLVERSQGRTMRQFLDQFRTYDYVYNDARIAHWMKGKMFDTMMTNMKLNQAVEQS